MGTRAERFASIHSVLDSALNAVIDSVIHSDPNKYLPTVEPVAEGPEDAEDEEALGDGAASAGEEVVAEPGLADAADPAGGLDLVV